MATRHVRVRGPNGIESGTVEDRHVVLAAGTTIELLDHETLELPEAYQLLAPIEAPEVWYAGVTYERSHDPRVEQSTAADPYSLVYEAPRPDLYMKDSGMRRTVGPRGPIGIRDDSTWNVPQPEIGVVLGTRGRIAGLTIGNNVASRDIERANPLYASQAKIYAGACAIGPAVYVPDNLDSPLHIRTRVTDEWGRILFEGETFTARMRRSYAELVHWLLLDNPVPPGSILLTGTGLSLPDTFTLIPGHFVEIHVPEIGTLFNPVVRASELIESEPAPVNRTPLA